MGGVEVERVDIHILLQGGGGCSLLNVNLTPHDSHQHVFHS